MAELFSTHDHVIVCGYGATGQFVARDIAAEGLQVAVVDRSPERVSQAEQDGHIALLGDVLEPEVLKEAGIERARGVILVLPSESDNLFCTMTARDLAPDVFIIARHTSAHARDKFLRAGADRVVNPFQETGRMIGNEFLRPAVVDLMRIFTAEDESEDDVRVREITIEEGSDLVGQSLIGADIRAKMDIIVIAMRKAGASTRLNPDPVRAFAAGDVLVCMGKLPKLRELHDRGRGTAS